MYVHRETTQMTGTPTHTKHLTTHLTCTQHRHHDTRTHKLNNAPDPVAPLSTQIYLLNLLGGDETLYESLHAVLSCSVKPWFHVFVGIRAGAGKDPGGGREGGEAKLGMPMTKKKLAELGLSLLHLQPNVEIPETDLVVHPVIQRAVELVGSLFL